MNWPTVRPRGEDIAPGPVLAPGQALDLAGKKRVRIEPRKTFEVMPKINSQQDRDKRYSWSKARI